MSQEATNVHLKPEDRELVSKLRERMDLPGVATPDVIRIALRRFYDVLNRQDKDQGSRVA